MKTLLFILMTGMIFLLTPMSASADRWGHNSQHRYDQGQERGQKDRYHYDWRHNHHNRRNNHRGNRELKWELRETRHQLYRARRQIRHQQRYTYDRHQPTLVIGVPPLVFLFGW